MLLQIAIFCLIVYSAISSSCENNCATCRDQFLGDYYCLACKEGYQTVTTYGICIQDSTISNCALYDLTLDCLKCQPSFQQSVNLCSKMYDGCLIYQQNGCNLCLEGSLFNPDTRSCTINYLNCKEISNNGSCISCFSKYQLQNGKCIYNSSLCITLNLDTGIKNHI